MACEIRLACETDAEAISGVITAQGFYARLGFEVVEDRYYGDERTIIMKRSLRP